MNDISFRKMKRIVIVMYEKIVVFMQSYDQYETSVVEGRDSKVWFHSFLLFYLLNR